MIIGLIAKNYKCYKGINFIPFIKDNPEYLRVIIGNNGAGKSAILEALDSFFNDEVWNINTEAHRNDASIGILFLMEKEKAKKILKNEDRNFEILSLISEYFWSVKSSENGNYLKHYKEFFDLRDVLSKYNSTHFLFILGKEFNKKELTFLTFHSSVVNKLSSLDPKPTILTLTQISEEILDHYSYLHIPVESSISDFLRLEARGMQILMDKNIRDNIADIFNEKRVTRADKKKKRQYAFLDIINDNLETYISSVEKQIQKIDTEYNFKKGYRQSTRLTSNHIIDVILNAYYTKRYLKKGEKPINALSSGEKRRALIDIIYAFINQSETAEKELILAIDEPESSLHISKCYEQFERIQSLAIGAKKTVFVATHWYGSLPILKCGSLMHIDEASSISMFNLLNYFEERRDHPDDIHFKSFFDLSSSILGALRSSKYNWLLVEGSEDKIYLEYYINTSDLNLKILPLGGCSNVKKVYEYLFVPISSKRMEETNGNGQKVFCLIDTDLTCTDINVDSETKNSCLKIRRLQEFNTDHSVKLVRIDDPNQSPIEIEEVLEPTTFYSALNSSIQKYGNDEEKQAFSAFDFDANVSISKISGDYSILSYNGKGTSNREDKEVMKKFIDNNKEVIAKEYKKIPRVGNIPTWITEIISFFKK